MRGTGLDRVPRFISPPLFNSFIPFFIQKMLPVWYQALFQVLGLYQ